MVRKPTRMPFSAGPPRGERERPQGGSWTLGCSPQSPLKPVRTSPLQSLVQSTCVGGRKTEVPPSPMGERALCGVSSRRAPTGYRDAPTLASASFPSSSTSGGGHQHCHSVMSEPGCSAFSHTQFGKSQKPAFVRPRYPDVCFKPQKHQPPGQISWCPGAGLSPV